MMGCEEVHCIILFIHWQCFYRAVIGLWCEGLKVW